MIEADKTTDQDRYDKDFKPITDTTDKYSDLCNQLQNEGR